MNLKDALVIRNTLRGLLIGDKHPEVICKSLQTALGDGRLGYDFVNQVSQGWPLCLKDSSYMVPNPDNLEYPISSYKQHQLRGTLLQGAYGENRRSLCLFLLEDIERRITKTKKQAEYLQPMRIRKACRAVLANPDKDQGICAQKPLAVFVHIGKYKRTWSQWSGWSGYFIPHPAYIGKQANATHALLAFQSIPKWEGAYGDLRRDFLRHVIAETTKELDAVEVVPYEKVN